ncbi:MAG: leucine-rich repeat protein [Butyrivibrio sp.]|nr:leucine-rich repeat protein [Butyrivibrio sp.]
MRKQRVFAVITAAVMSVGAFFMTGISAKADDSVKAQAEETGEKTEGDWRYRVLEDGTSEITGYDGEATELEIPDSVGGARVTSLGYNIFDGLGSYESVTVPKSVTHIEEYSFGWIIDDSPNSNINLNMIGLRVYGYVGSAAETYAKENGYRFSNIEKEWEYIVGDDDMAYISGYNGKMTEVEIPSSVDGYKVIGTAYWPDMMGAGIFGENDLIESIIIPEGVKYIGSYSFYSCKSLRTIAIPDSVIEIGYGAFSNCSSLNNVEIPEDIVEIGMNTFSDCSSLKNIKIPNGVVRIGWMAFSGCTSLKDVEIPNSVISMDNCVFYGCISLENIKLSEKMTEVPYGLTEGCTSLRNVEIPYGVVKIASSAFSGVALESVSISDSVTEIGAFAFCHSKIKSIRIPKNVSIIGEKAFGYIAGEYIDGEGREYVTIPDFTIYGYPDTAAEAYAKENGFTFIEIKDEPVEEPTQTPSEAEITVNASGELSPKLETAKNAILSAIAKYLTEDELSAVKAGASALDIKLSVASLDGSVSESDKELIARAADSISDASKLDFKVMNYLDVKFSVSIDGREINVTETDGLLTVSVELENPMNGTYKVIRIHDGKAEAIDAQLSKDGKRLSFATDKFSTYAIVYSDVASGDSAYFALTVILMFAALGVVALLTVNKFKAMQM